MAKRALISVSDKTGVVEFARGLVALGFEIVSTGGTYRTLTEAGLAVRYVTEITGFPEILDGRVKTLHPAIHGGILARDTQTHREQLKQNGIEMIDVVAVNLYPFKQTIAKPNTTFAEAIENIDIGGPTLVRAAAKNHERVTIVVNPLHYAEVLAALEKEGTVPEEMRRQLAGEAFCHTADYDRLIADYLEQQNSQKREDRSLPQTLRLNANKVQDLRYGENPIQKAAFYVDSQAGQGSLARGTQLQGKELSYNNWMDMDAAWEIAREFQDCVCVIIKHTNPCGIALGSTPLEAYERALAADPVSAFGGILAFNQVVDAECAQALKRHFFEVIVAPGFSDQAREILSAKANLRLFVVEEGERSAQGLRIRTVNGGYLVQEADFGTSPSADWETVTDAKATAEDLAQLEFAWKAVKHVKSNAILVSKDGQTIGVGAGQMNRVGSVKIALEQAGHKAQGAYLASDAFFPFPDSIEEAAKQGIRAIVQPGGSVRDEEVIAAANRLGLIMVFTKRRHFKH